MNGWRNLVNVFDYFAAVTILVSYTSLGCKSKSIKKEKSQRNSYFIISMDNKSKVLAAGAAFLLSAGVACYAYYRSD